MGKRGRKGKGKKGEKEGKRREKEEKRKRKKRRKKERKKEKKKPQKGEKNRNKLKLNCADREKQVESNQLANCGKKKPTKRRTEQVYLKTGGRR